MPKRRGQRSASAEQRRRERGEFLRLASVAVDGRSSAPSRTNADVKVEVSTETGDNKRAKLAQEPDGNVKDEVYLNTKDGKKILVDDNDF